MADTKITGFTADTTPVGADLITTVKSPFGAGSNRKVTITNFFGALAVSPIPVANDGIALGSATKSFSDLFLADGGVINWNNGNTTLTQSAGALTANGSFQAATLTDGTVSINAGVITGIVSLSQASTPTAADSTGIDVSLTLGADEDGMTGIISTINGFASGGASGNESFAYKASLNGNANDTDHAYYGIDFGDFTANGGAGEATAFVVGDNYSYVLDASSGDFFFGDHPTTMEFDFKSDLTAATEVPSMTFGGATKTWEAGAGPLAEQSDFIFENSEYVGNAGGALTITDAATVHITGAPIAGSDMTLTNFWGLWNEGSMRTDGPSKFNDSVGIGTASIDTSAILDIASTTQGMLPPRMTTAQRDNIGTPAEGLFLYNSDQSALNWYDGSVWEEASAVAYGEFKIAENSTATTIRDTAQYQAITTNVVTGLVDGFTYDAGQVGVIASVADAGGGDITVTDVGHGLVAGDMITINGTTNYDGIYEVKSAPTADTFTVTAAYVATNTGYWQQGASLTVNAGGAGTYKGSWSATGISASPTQVFDFCPVVNTTVATAACARRTFSNTDYGSFSGTELVTLAEGDVIHFVVRNNTATNDITIRALDLNLHRL